MASDHELLQGFWKLTRTTLNDQAFKHPNVGTLFQFTGNRFRHIRSRLSYRFELHPELSPKGIDLILVSTKGVNRGLYVLNDDTLVIQSSNGWNGPRPTAFSDPNVPTEYYIRFERRLKVKSRVKALIPAECIKEGIVPEDVNLTDLLNKKANSL